MSAIDDIKQRIDIVAGVSRYVPLQKAGRNFRTLCPFHEEKTPSFYVFPDGQSWHCFGACGTGGDLFSFVMKKENVPFGDALRSLAELAGVTLPDRNGAIETADASNRARLLQAMEDAAQFYRTTLLHGPEAAAARSYLQDRALALETQEKFQLGYSPAGWGVLLKHLRDRGFGDELLIEAGLAIQGDSGLHDRFRGRVMFPLHDVRGRVIAFGARTLDGTPPKYLNSPQTPLFDKGALLYGLDVARNAIRKEDRAVIVEGYVDAIMAHQAGFTNVVASMGTTLTERQVALLRGTAHQIVLALDPDTAGEEATLRGVTVLSDALDRKVVPVPVASESGRGLRVLIRYEQSIDTEIRIAVLPKGKDPDQVVREDPENWRRLVAGSLPVLDYVMTAATSGLDVRNSRDVGHAADQVLPFIGDVLDPVRRSHEVQRLARLLQVDERALQVKLGETTSSQAQGAARTNKRRGATSQPAAVPTQGVGQSDGWDQMEDTCLALLLQHPECAEAAAGLEEEHFSLPERRAVVAAWHTSGSLPQFWDTVDATLFDYVSQLLSWPLPPGATPDSAAALRQSYRRLEERRLRRAKTQETRLLQDPSGQGDEVSRLSFAIWQGEQPEASEGDESGNELLAMAEAQRQGLDINERLRAIFHEKFATTPSGNET